MNLFTELKRRNVFRVAVFYVVAAWVIVQVAETVLPVFEVPDGVLRGLVIVLALGFVPAVIFAWVFEWTPDGIRRETEVDVPEAVKQQTAHKLNWATLAVAVLAIGLLIADRMLPGSTQDARLSKPTVAVEADAPTISPAPSASASIAVLPFVNMSPDAENEYFADGISEELLNVLVKVEDIGVASRTSSFAYKGRELGAAVIARELKVNHILEGSVRKSGNRVRITAQLIDAAADRHLWSETYDRELTDIFAIQDEIANAIVAALRGTLGSAEEGRAVTVRADTENLDAYQRYLKARELFLTRTTLEESVRLFEEVVALDPAFARGWEGLAAVSGVLIDWKGFYPEIDTEALHARSLEAAERALELDPKLGLPWAVRGMLLQYHEPILFARSLALFDQALKIDPSLATVHLWRAIGWLNLGFLERADADLDACLAIDPAYSNCLRWKALVVAFLGDDARALTLFERGVATGFVGNRAGTFIERLVARGDRLAPMLLLGSIQMPPELQQATLTAMQQRAPPSDIDALLARYPAFDEAGTHMMLRAYDRAARSPEQLSSLAVHWDPVYADIRGTPAFRRILERMGVPEYWREHGYPRQCRPIGEDDFECE